MMKSIPVFILAGVVLLIMPPAFASENERVWIMVLTDIEYEPIIINPVKQP